VVASKDEGLTGSLSRLSEDIRPKQNAQNVRKWIKLLRTIFRSKILQNLQYAVDRMRILTASKYGKEHLIAYRLKKLFNHVTISAKGYAFRKIIRLIAHQHKTSSYKTIKNKEALFTKAINSFGNMLDHKIRSLQGFTFAKLIINKKIISKADAFARTTKLKVLNELYKTKLAAGFLKIQSVSINNKTRLAVARCLKNLEVKANLNKHFALIKIVKRAA
jgi:hypothetical protein